MEHTRAFLAYDTLCRIAAEIPEDGEQLLEQCEEEAHGLERTLSMFDPDSELSRLCRDIRPGEAVPVSETCTPSWSRTWRSAACPAEHSTPRWGRW